MDNTDKPFLTISEHSKAFFLAANTVKNRILHGTWPAKPVKIGKLILIPRVEHERVIAEMLVSAGIGIQPTGGISSTDPHQSPITRHENLLVGQKRAPGRPRPRGGMGVK
ncbi:hypothetical protein GALL_493800 [mine drainage metagenome]|uniref:Uncharacterized protein n=1 Tax=mine drainage metagenome TaxID=410659 RepID=A0A1J5PZH8_9ZZZZ